LINSTSTGVKMNIRFLFAAAAVAAAVCTVNAQSARIDAMGSTGIIVNDVTGVMNFPAYLLDYPDYISVTYSGSVGPLFGIKKINDEMSGGIYYSQKRMLDVKHYTFLAEILADSVSSTIGIDESAVDAIPHLLYAIDLDFAKLGVDLFCERAFFTSGSIAVDDGDETTIVTKGTYLNPGFLASLNFENMRFALGLSVPIGSHSITAESSAGKAEETAKSHRSVYGSVAGEMNGEIMDILWLAGLSYSINMYTGTHETKPATGATVSADAPKRLLMTPAVYGGISKELDEYGILLAATAKGAYMVDRVEPDNVTAALPNLITREDTLTFSINTGLEKTWDDLKRLDAIYTRAGLVWLASIGINRKYGESGGDEYYSRTRDTTVRNGFAFPLGIGIQKSLFTLDVQIDPGCLINSFKLVNGALAGSDFVKATLTVDFGSGLGRKEKAELPEIPESEPAVKPSGSDLKF
jgi:hypothetical protein